MNFNELQLDHNLLRGIAATGFEQMLPVQQQTLPLALAGKDVTVQSQTGSGKTAAFLVAIFQQFLEKGNLKKEKALVIVPTRELAVQIDAEAGLLGRHLPFVTGSFYGGVGYVPQETLLRKGVDIVVATPGRLLDFSRSGKLNLARFDLLVIDEADRLFDMGFLPDIRRILQGMKPRDRRQTMLFSATLGDEACEIASALHESSAQNRNQPRAIDRGQRDPGNLPRGQQRKMQPAARTAEKRVSPQSS